MTALHSAGWPPPEPDDRDGTHGCPVPGCGLAVDDDRLMCRADWYRVRRVLRAAVWAAWDGGRGAGSAAHLAAMRAAVGAARRARERER